MKLRVIRFGSIGCLVTRDAFNLGQVDIVPIKDPFIDIEYTLYVL